MRSDGIVSMKARAPDEVSRLELGPVLEDLNPAPMQPAPVDGRCPRATMWKASCKSRGCPVCGPRWARNQRTKIASNLEYMGGKFATIAITGPGKKGLPWDDHYCFVERGMRPHKHSGSVHGCRVDQRRLREWCASLTYRWQRLRQAAQKATYEAVGERVWIVERVWEPQKRGVPHLHLVVPYGTPAERKVANVFRANLAKRSHDYLFGNVQAELHPISGEEAARYLASYLAGRTRKKNSIRENIADPRLPKSLLWETPVLSSVSESPRMVAWRERYGIKLGTGVTMRTLRRMRHLWACIEGYCDELPRWSGMTEAVLIVAVLRRINPKRAGPLREDWGAALEYARAADRQQEKVGGWDLCYYDPKSGPFGQWLPNQPLYESMAQIAFRWTLDPNHELAAAA